MKKGQAGSVEKSNEKGDRLLYGSVENSAYSLNVNCKVTTRAKIRAK